MKLLIFTPEISNLPNYKNIISAHVQLPYSLYHFLKKSLQNDIYFVTTKKDKSKEFPDIIDINDTNLFFITNSYTKPDSTRMTSGKNLRINYFKVLYQLWELNLFIKKNKITHVNSFGSNKVAVFFAILSYFNNSVIFIHNQNFTFYFNKISLFLIKNKKNFSFLTSTKYGSNELTKYNLKNDFLLQPEIFKRNCDESQKKFRVLFWRDPSLENGFDFCLNVFNKIKYEFPNIKFTLALRDHTNFNLEELDLHGLEVFKVPYPIGTINKLISESYIILMPFRRLSVNPQLAIIESLNTNALVLTTNIESSSEYVDSINLIPFDLDSVTDLVRKLLTNNNLYDFHLSRQIIKRNTFLSFEEYSFNYFLKVSNYEI